MPPLALAAALGGGTAGLAYAIKARGPFALDRDTRALVHRHISSRTRTILAPIFPLGLPGVYITIAYGTAWWLRAHRRAGGPAIVTSGWLGWFVHRGIKVFYHRERPRIPRVRRRYDSYPSGHTTGATALAVTTALVLRRDGVLSNRAALALGIGAPLAMGVYRVIDDEHWTTDVIGGWMLGGCIALTCFAMLGGAGAAPIRPVRRTRAVRAATG